MAPSTSMRPVTNSDIATLGEFLYPCKLDLTINRLLYNDWPNEAAQKPNYEGAVKRGFEDPSMESLKIIDDKSGDILAYLALTRRRHVAKKPEEEKPAATDEGEGEKQQPAVPDWFNPGVLAMVGETVGEINKAMEGTDHYEITYICVKHASRRQGLGSQLVQVAFDKAKAEGVPLAVTAEPAAYEFFSKLGFKDMKHVDMDLRKFAAAYSGFGIFRLVGMIWNP